MGWNPFPNLNRATVPMLPTDFNAVIYILPAAILTCYCSIHSDGFVLLLPFMRQRDTLIRRASCSNLERSCFLWGIIWKHLGTSVFKRLEGDSLWSWNVSILGKMPGTQIVKRIHLEKGYKLSKNKFYIALNLTLTHICFKPEHTVTSSAKRKRESFKHGKNSAEKKISRGKFQPKNSLWERAYKYYWAFVWVFFFFTKATSPVLVAMGCGEGASIESGSGVYKWKWKPWG